MLTILVRRDAILLATGGSGYQPSRIRAHSLFFSTHAPVFYTAFKEGEVRYNTDTTDLAKFRDTAHLSLTVHSINK